MRYQQQRPPRRNGLKFFVPGAALLAVVVVVLVATRTWYIWPSIVGIVFVVVGLVMMVTKR